MEAKDYLFQVIKYIPCEVYQYDENVQKKQSVINDELRKLFIDAKRYCNIDDLINNRISNNKKLNLNDFLLAKKEQKNLLKSVNELKLFFNSFVVLDLFYNRWFLKEGDGIYKIIKNNIISFKEKEEILGELNFIYSNYPLEFSRLCDVDDNLYGNFKKNSDIKIKMTILEEYHKKLGFTNELWEKNKEFLEIYELYCKKYDREPSDNEIINEYALMHKKNKSEVEKIFLEIKRINNFNNPKKYTDYKDDDDDSSSSIEEVDSREVPDDELPTNFDFGIPKKAMNFFDLLRSEKMKKQMCIDLLINEKEYEEMIKTMESKYEDILRRKRWS